MGYLHITRLRATGMHLELGALLSGQMPQSAPATRVQDARTVRYSVHEASLFSVCMSPPLDGQRALEPGARVLGGHRGRIVHVSNDGGFARFSLVGDSLELRALDSGVSGTPSEHSERAS